MTDKSEWSHIVLNDDDEILVCSECKQASCWFGKIMCYNYVDAGTETKTIKELRKLNHEHESYWKRSVFEFGRHQKV